jgi:hypothetical protein
MPSISMDCPTGGNISVHLLGSGSGSPGTICVCGHYFDTFSMKSGCLNLLTAVFGPCLHWFVAVFKPKPNALTELAGPFVRVRVVNGSVSTFPDPKYITGDVDVAPIGQLWCASGVPVPTWSASGADLTVFAWLFNGSGGVDDKKSALFKGGGSGAIDCCSGCGSGSGFRTSLFASELASHPRLEVSVQDGPNAGRHTARSVSYLTWEVSIHGVIYKVSCDAGTALVIRGPSSSAASTAVEGGPFSAIFPGAVFGAVRDVVVTKA